MNESSSPPGGPESPAREIIHRVADRLHKQAIRLLRRLRREDVSTGLSPARASALSVLVFTGPLTLGALALAEQVSAPTMSRVVAALTGDGLVKRETDPEDGRVVRLRATAKGVRLLQQGRARRLRAFGDLLAPLDDDELAVLLRATELLERVVR
ncbi:MAG: MarR family transcriptional regulator [Acidobacteriota bacterium]